MVKSWIQRATAATVAQWIAAISLVVAPALGQNSPSLKLLREFETTTVFFEQFEIGEKLVAMHDPAIATELLPWLSHQDRHLRANAAYVIARYGDKRGFDAGFPTLDPPDFQV